MITITVNGQVRWTGSDRQRARRVLDRVLKSGKGVIEVQDGGKRLRCTKG